MIDKTEATYYELLDVPLDAKNLEIIRAYRRAKLTYRVDSMATYSLFDDMELEHIRDEIERAYQTLSNPEKRQAYDDELAACTQDRQIRQPDEEKG